MLALLSSQNSTLRWLDAQMFRLASNLLPALAEQNDFRVIKLDEARLQKPEGIREFRFFLRKLRKSDAAEIVWLSDDFPQMDFVQIEEQASESKNTKQAPSKSKEKSSDAAPDSEEDEQKWRPTQGERNKLA